MIGTALAVLLVLATARGAPPGAGGPEALEAAGRWPEALAAWRACARDPDDRRARRCAARAAQLGPHAADGFAGWRRWRELAGLRDVLPPAELARRALAARTGGPADADLLALAASAAARAGDAAGERAAWEALRSLPEAPRRLRRLARARLERQAAARRRALAEAAGVGAGLVGVLGLLGPRSRRPLALSSLVAGVILVAGVPWALVVAWGVRQPWVPGLLAAWLAVVVLLARAFRGPWSPAVRAAAAVLAWCGPGVALLARAGWWRP